MGDFSVTRGATSQLFTIALHDSSSLTGALLSGLLNSSTNLTVQMRRAFASTATSYTGANIETIATLGTFAAPSLSSRIRFKETTVTGVYELQVHDSATNGFGSGDASPYVDVKVYEATTTALNLVPVVLKIPLTAFDFQTAAGTAPSAATVASAVWDLDATAHQILGSFGQALGDPGSDSDTIWALVNANLDAAVSSRLATAGYTAPPSAATNANAVWDALLAAHTIAGSAGQKLGSLSGGGGTAPTASEVATAVWTAVIAEVSNDADLRVSIGKMMRGVFERFFNKVTQTPSVQTVFKDDSVTTLVTMTIADDGITQTKGKSS